MNGRQRILNTIHNLPADRTPVCPFIHINFVKAFFADPEIDPIAATAEVYRHFGLDIIHRNCTPAYDENAGQNRNWQVEKTVESAGRDQTTVTTITTPGGQLSEVQKISWPTTYDAEITPVEYFIRDEGDLDLFMQYQPAVAEIDTTPIRRARETVGEDGVVAPWIQGAFNHVGYFYRRLEDLLMDAMLRPEFYGRMMEYFFERNRQIAGQYIDAGADLLSYGGNIASGKMVGPDFFRDHVLPYEKKLIDYIQSRGAAVLYHNCGYARNLFAHFNVLGMDVYESLTAPPYGDTLLEEALQQIRPEIALHGGIDQIDFLMRAAPDDVRRKAGEVLAAARDRGRFILGTSDYLHEETPHANIAALAETTIGQ